jgi:hypothetical protein
MIARPDTISLSLHVPHDVGLRDLILNRETVCYLTTLASNAKLGFKVSLFKFFARAI